MPAVRFADRQGDSENYTSDKAEEDADRQLCGVATTVLEKRQNPLVQPLGLQETALRLRALS